MCATFLAAVIIITGTETILEGPSGLLSGLGKSIGGFLIWLTVGALSLPLGLALRLIWGRFRVQPLPVAVATGVATGWILIPLLNPAISPVLTFSTNPIGLLVVYSLAGGFGGVVWWSIEFGRGSGENV
jgi:hypothetical protein